MVTASNDDTLRLEDVPVDHLREDAEIPTEDAGATLRALRTQAERQIIVDALTANEWHISRTARQLGLSDHSSLLRIMRRHGLRKS